MSSYSIPPTVKESLIVEPPVVQECFPTYNHTERQVMKPYPKYKDSGVEWLGEVPEGWKLKKLKYASCINPTKEATLDKNSSELVTFLPMESVSESGQISCDNKKPISSMWSGFTYFKKHDVIIAKITPCFENGKGALLNNLDTEIGFGSTEFHVLRAIENVSSAFLFYVTRTYQFRLLGEAFMSGAAGQKRVSTDFLENFFIALPSCSEQTTIATFLDRKTAEIDTLIANKERLIKLYEEKKKAVINQAVTKGLNPDAEMKDSGVEWLGEIPKHWEVKRLRHLFEIKKRIAGELGHDVLSITQRGIKVKDIESMDGQISSDYSKYQLVMKGDFAMNHMDLLTGYVDLSKYNGVTSPDYRVFSLSDTNNCDRYFLYLFQLGYKRKIFYAFGRGAAQFGRWRFPAEEFKAFGFPIPPVSEQTTIVHHIETQCSRIDAIINKLKKQINLFKEYRTALISEAVTGKIDVRNNG